MMARLVRAELVKLRATPSTWWLAALAIAAVVFGITLTMALVDVRTETDARSIISFSGTGGLVLVLLGLVWTAGEHRHRTIIPTMLVAPRRVPPFLAQMMALAAVGAVVGLVSGVMAVAITVGWLAAEGSSLVTPGMAAAPVLGGILYSALAAALGGGLGALTRNQVAAAIAVFLYLGTADPLLAMAIPSYGQFGPTALGIALSGGAEAPGGPGSQLLPFGLAVAAWVGYTAVLIVAGLAATVRRDVR